MTCWPGAHRMRFDVKADEAPGGVELRLASVRHQLPELWDRAAAALAMGQEQVAGLALRRRQVLLRELDNLTQLVASKVPEGRLLPRIEAAIKLLDASLSETARTGQPQPREPVVLDLDPAVQSDLRRLRAALRNETRRRPVVRRRKGGA